MDKIKPGDVILLSFPKHNPQGHEQEGLRPAIVIALSTNNVRYPVAIVVPLTTQDGEWADKNSLLYKRIIAGTAGLTKDSIALIDQIRAIDLQRATSYIGRLDRKTFSIIRDSLISLINGT